MFVLLSIIFYFLIYVIYEYHGLFDLIFSSFRADLPMPKKFILGIDIEDTQTNESNRVNVEILRPAFGDENCDLGFDWYADLGTGTGDFTREEVNVFKKIHLCREKL